MTKERALEALNYLDGLIDGLGLNEELRSERAQGHIDALHKFITEGEAAE